ESSAHPDPLLASGEGEQDRLPWVSRRAPMAPNWPVHPPDDSFAMRELLKPSSSPPSSLAAGTRFGPHRCRFGDAKSWRARSAQGRWGPEKCATPRLAQWTPPIARGRWRSFANRLPPARWKGNAERSAPRGVDG